MVDENVLVHHSSALPQASSGYPVTVSISYTMITVQVWDVTVMESRMMAEQLSQLAQHPKPHPLQGVKTDAEVSTRSRPQKLQNQKRHRSRRLNLAKLNY